MIKKLKQVFARETVGARRKALLELEKMLPQNTLEYFNLHIKKEWKHLTKSLTTNAAERWNRKIKKIVSGKYGLKRPETIQQLVYCLWFKELITNGGQHLAVDAKITNINMSKICQEILSNDRIEHLFTITNQRKAS